MLSCGKSAHDRKDDIENILGENNFTSSSGDEHFCPDTCVEPHQEEPFTFSDLNSDILSIRAVEPDDPTKYMVRQSMRVTTLVFLFIGLLFTFTNIIFTLVNIVSNPVSAIVGIDGLVAWNIIAGLMYFLVVVIWGAEYNIKLRRNLCVSDTLRQSETGIVLESHSSIGWCCLLLICPMFLHLGTGCMFAWRQWKRYYNKKSKLDTQMRINVQDPTQGGTDILF